MNEKCVDLGLLMLLLVFPLTFSSVKKIHTAIESVVVRRRHVCVSATRLTGNNNIRFVWDDLQHEKKQVCVATRTECS